MDWIFTTAENLFQYVDLSVPYSLTSKRIREFIGNNPQICAFIENNRNKERENSLIENFSEFVRRK